MFSGKIPGESAHVHSHCHDPLDGSTGPWCKTLGSDKRCRMEYMQTSLTDSSADSTIPKQ